MAWTDPFENLVETTVDDLGNYLRAQEKFSEHDIARIQEVCRDFCHFHCKDIRKATKQDYAFYLQLHAMSAEDEREYAAMLSNIQKFAMSAEPAPEAPVQPEPQAPRQRERKITKETLQSETAISELFMLSENEEHGAQLQPPTESFQFPRHTGNAQTSDMATPLPGAKSVAHNKINAHQLSDEEADMLNNQTNLPLSMIRNSNGAPKPDDIAKQQQATPQKPLIAQPKPDNIAKQQQATPQKPLIAQPAEQQAPAPVPAPPDPDLSDQDNVPADRMRSVSGVAYNFNKDSLQKMRDFEKKQARATSTSDAGPIDMALVGNFRPYLFDSKYMIDRPLAKPEDMTTYPPQFLIHYLIPLTPSVLLLILAAILFQIVSAAGLVCLVLALITLAFVLPDVLPAVQQTPQAALNAYLNARAGRCYGRGSTILARNKEASKELDMPALWAPEPKWPQAFLNRFKKLPPVSTRVVSGAETQNAILLIHADDTSYFLVSMVRIGAKWYICDPDLAPKAL